MGMQSSDELKNQKTLFQPISMICEIARNFKVYTTNILVAKPARHQTSELFKGSGKQKREKCDFLPFVPGVRRDRCRNRSRL
jgi:hypothetical protein